MRANGRQASAAAAMPSASQPVDSRAGLRACGWVKGKGVRFIYVDTLSPVDQSAT